MPSPRSVQRILPLLFAGAAPLAAQSTPSQAAESLYRAGKYAEAAARYRAVLDRDSTQIGVLMGLGQATARAGRPAEAIGWYRRALDAGVVPLNLIAYLIGQQFARLGSRDSTIAWLDRALGFRLERRSRIASDSFFSQWRDDPEFRRLAGRPVRELTDRTERWRADIDHLVAEVRRMHAGPDRPGWQPRYQAAADSLKARVGSLSDLRMAAEIQRLIALLGDGHSILYPQSTPTIDLTRVPLDLWFFSDGAVVVGADDSLAQYLGRKLVAVGGVPTLEVLRLLDPYMSRDNAMGRLVFGSFLVTSPAFMEAIGAGSGRIIEYSFETTTGSRETAKLTAQGSRPPGFKLLPVPGSAPEKRPRYLRHPDFNVWLETLPEANAVYAQYNQVADGPTMPVAAFADSLTRTLRRTSARELIVDVRRNNGGNNGLNQPLIRAMIAFEMEQGGRIWILTSRTTFSAAQNFLNQAERWTKATIVGEPSGSKPNFAGEDTELILPYSGLRGSISTRWWQDSGPLDRRQWIAPHLSVPVSSADHFAGRDPVLEAVLSAIREGDRGRP
jgi:hypothetical protein